MPEISKHKETNREGSAQVQQEELHLLGFVKADPETGNISLGDNVSLR